jgi:hypothetical protein
MIIVRVPLETLAYCRRLSRRPARRRRWLRAKRFVLSKSKIIFSAIPFIAYRAALFYKKIAVFEEIAA